MAGLKSAKKINDKINSVSKNNKKLGLRDSIKNKASNVSQSYNNFKNAEGFKGKAGVLGRGIGRRAKNRGSKVFNSIKNSAPVQAIIKTAKRIFKAVFKIVTNIFLHPIRSAIIAGIITAAFTIVPMGIGLFQNFGATPHYYCSRHTLEEIADLEVYQQYCKIPPELCDIKNKTTNDSGGSFSDGEATELGEKVKEATKTVGYAGKDSCQAWVREVIAKCGDFNHPSLGVNFIGAYQAWTYYKEKGITHTEKENIPIGAMVYGSGSGDKGAQYGHVGIYLGNGLVADNEHSEGREINSWCSLQTAKNADGKTGWKGWVSVDDAKKVFEDGGGTVSNGDSGSETSADAKLKKICDDKKKSSSNDYVEKAIEFSKDPEVGYASQMVNGSLQRVHPYPNMDCSQLVYFSLKECGYDVGNSAFSTRDMGGILEKAGFKLIHVSPSEYERGDILHKKGHTEIYIGDGQNVGAHWDYDGKKGDGGDKEVNIGSTYSFDNVYRLK